MKRTTKNAVVARRRLRKATSDIRTTGQGDSLPSQGEGPEAGALNVKPPEGHADPSTDDTPSSTENGVGGSSANSRAGSIGYGSPPKDTRWKKGQSGNPRGRLPEPEGMPGNIHSLIGKTFIEELSVALRTPLRDLGPSVDDIAVAALARQVVTNALKGNIWSQKLIMEAFVDKQWSSERYQEFDAGALEAERMSEMIKLIVDPTMSDKQRAEMMERLAHVNRQRMITANSPIGPLPPLPPPPRKRDMRRHR